MKIGAPRLSLSSFRARLTLQWTAVFGLVLVLTLAGVYVGLRHNLQSALEADLRTLAATEVASGIDEVQGVHLHDFDHPAIVNERHLEKFVQILAEDGGVVKQSDRLTSRAPLVSDEVRRAAFEGQSQVTGVLLDGVPGYGVSLLAEKDGQRYVFVVAASASHIESALKSLARTLILMGFVALAATALVGYRLATAALRPVDLIARRARLIGFDHLKVRLEEPETDDELGRLTRLLNDMLDRLYRLIEAHQRLAADASHELRTPLTALRGQIEVALRQARSAEHYRGVLESALEEVDRLTKLTEDLLELTRSDARRLDLELYEVELRPLARSVLSQFEPEAAARRVRLAEDVPADLAVIADPSRLRRLLANLVSNAIHYSKPEGGRVAVRAGRGDDEVWIEVEDTGVGMDAEQQAHAFERFWRADRSRAFNGGGAGLGLAICEEIAAAHGGKIRLTSAPGVGSNFRVCLPSQ